MISVTFCTALEHRGFAFHVWNRVIAHYVAFWVPGTACLQDMASLAMETKMDDEEKHEVASNPIKEIKTYFRTVPWCNLWTFNSLHIYDLVTTCRSP